MLIISVAISWMNHPWKGFGAVTCFYNRPSVKKQECSQSRLFSTKQTVRIIYKRMTKAGVHLNAICPPRNMALMEISLSRFKQSKTLS